MPRWTPAEAKKKITISAITNVAAVRLPPLNRKASTTSRPPERM